MKIRRLTTNKSINTHLHSCATSPCPFGSPFTLVSALYGLEVTSLLLFLRALLLNRRLQQNSPHKHREGTSEEQRISRGGGGNESQERGTCKKKAPKKKDFKAALLNTKSL